MKKISEDIYYVGVNDREKMLFENYIPIPRGVSYNSYLIVDETVALIDTVEVGFTTEFFAKLDECLGGASGSGRKIDYLVVDHVEPDHSGAIRLLMMKYPEMVIVGNARTIQMLEGFYGHIENTFVVKEGDFLNLGKHNLKFYLAPMVHWPEVMVTFDEASGTLFSADAFGTFGALTGGVLDTEIDLEPFWDEMRRYYACIVGKYGAPVQTALKKLAALNIGTVCSTHGPIWTAELPKVKDLYNRWSLYNASRGAVIAYGSMYGHTREMAEEVAAGLVEAGVKNVGMYDVSHADVSYILSDVFQYRALVVGGPTYMNGMYPGIETLLEAVAHRGIKNHILGAFGEFTWGGVVGKTLAQFAVDNGWQLAADPVECKSGLTPEARESCRALGKAVADALAG
jgi:anaerobic nitric oxide reductase flavorubredoxin